jgi:4-amino-4-deoxy-L-arabinose transferase-like glycosyltransferase
VKPGQHLSTRQRLWLLGLLLAATWLYTWGLQRNLPYLGEADESIFVDRAVAMVSTNDWNPRWFGHPGSTIFYPLVAMYWLWQQWFGGPAADLTTYFAAEPWLFYYLARLLSVSYALLALPLTYQIGRRIFNPTTGLIGATFLLSYPHVLFHIKSVRTDGVGMTFALLAVWSGLKVYQRPMLRRQLLAGVSIGLGIASRYFLVLFTPLWLWFTWLAWRSESDSNMRRRQLLWAAAGLVAIGVSFAVSTPYFVLDFAGAWQSLVTEGRSTHPGADGLSRVQNFFWYFGQMARSEYGVVQTFFAIIGIGALLRERRPLPLSLIGAIVLFLAGISLSPLHWLRWALPIFPFAALVSAYGLMTVVTGLSRFASESLRQPLLIGLIAVAIAAPGLRAVQLSLQDATPSTRVAARAWLIHHLPAEARLIQEPYTALVGDDPRVTTIELSLGTEQTVDAYRCAGYTHLVISSYMYDRFLAEAARYPAEVDFYQTLLQQTEPVATFTPSWLQGGPTLQVYAIGSLESKACSVK